MVSLNTLFGGDALAWMDEVAFIAATRFCRKPLVTISSDRVDFKEAIPAGTFAELIAKVVHVGNTSLKVDVDILLETMHKDDKHSAISGSFTFVAVMLLITECHAQTALVSYNVHIS